MKTFLSLCAWVIALANPLRAQADSWRQTEHSLARLHGTNILWQIVADPAQGKPYFHPLATPGGTLLTALRPGDHPWHRGLWFSWKHLNGLNYWEEDRKTGRSEGTTDLLQARLEPHADGSATLNFSISYHPTNTPPILTEQRTITVSAPTNCGYEIRWTSEFTAVTNVLLDRTPLPGEPDGKSYGGYAGLSLRMDSALRGWTFSSSTAATGVPAIHGKPATWVKFSAGPGLPAVTIFDSAENPRQPTPWYAHQTMPFLNAALLFAQPLALQSGEKLTLHYRIHITDHDQPTSNKTSP